jgi:tetratricopeptide (TPR) repeat protein
MSRGPSDEGAASGRWQVLLDRALPALAFALMAVIAVFGVSYCIGQRGRGNDELVRRDIARYEQAVIDDPASLQARLALAEAYLAQGRYRDAQEQYQAAIQIEPQSVVALVGMGRAALNAGDEELAIASFRDVIDLAAKSDLPGDLVEASHYYLARIYLDQGDTDAAIEELQQALAIDRVDADAWYLLGQTYLQVDDLDGAIDAFSRAVTFVPNFREAYEGLARAYEERGMEAEHLYALGMVAYAQGDYAEAERTLEAALEASSDLVVAHVGLGLVRESRGERDLAIASYQEALRLDPENFNARAGLARLGAIDLKSVGEEAVP